MEYDINYLAILVSGIIAMVLGAIWYGPLFGKAWMRIIKFNAEDKAAMEKMKKGAWKLYIVQFLLVLLQVWILAHYIAGWEEASGVHNALWLWLGFVMPTIAAGSMWNNDSAKVSWARFLIQAGYQLVMFIIFGLIIGLWV